jgi:transcriptional regulator
MGKRESGKPGQVAGAARPAERVAAGSLCGSLEMLILKTLRHGGAVHGVQIAERIAKLSGRQIRVEVGALYPALHRLQRRRLVESEWRISDRGRRAKFYDLTRAGETALTEELQGWREHTRAIDQLFAALERAELEGAG